MVLERTEIDIDVLSNKLKEILTRRETLDGKLISAWEEYEKVEAQYKHEYHVSIDKAKAIDKDMTQTDLKAKAEVETFNQRLQVIAKQATYKRLQLQSERLHDEFEVLKELSYNERSKNRTLGSHV